MLGFQWSKKTLIAVWYTRVLDAVCGSEADFVKAKVNTIENFVESDVCFFDSGNLNKLIIDSIYVIQSVSEPSAVHIRLHFVEGGHNFVFEEVKCKIIALKSRWFKYRIPALIHKFDREFLF